MTTQSLATVKAQFSSYVDMVFLMHERVIITRNGEPAAVLISPDDLESMEETIALLSDPDALRDITEAKKAIEVGDVTPAEQFEFRARS